MVTLALSSHDLSTVLPNGTRVIPAGTYTVKVGGGNPRDPRVPTPVDAASFRFATGCVH